MAGYSQARVDLTDTNWLYKKPLKNISTDNNCKFVKVETDKLRKCTDNQNIRIQKNGMEIFIPVDIGVGVLEKVLGALTAK